MDELLQKAIERRDRLRLELEALDALIKAYTSLPPEPSVKAEQPDLFSGTKPTRREQAKAVHEMMTEAERIILESGKPMTRGALLRALEERGYQVVGGDKNKVLGTNLWRSRLFHNIQGIGYWPKSEPIPQGFRHFLLRDTKLS